MQESKVSSHFEQIESIVDQSSVDQLILKLSRICYEKSEHIESEWQDKKTARVWRRAAARLARLGGTVGC